MCNNVSQSCNFIQAVDKIISTFQSMLLTLFCLLVRLLLAMKQLTSS